MRSIFVCQQCGEDFPKWSGQCPNCGAWNSLVETQVEESRKSRTSRTGRKSDQPVSTPIKLSSIKKSDHSQRISTKNSELDRVLGGGLLPGMVTLVAGEPGIGKSTLLLQVAAGFENMIYIAGEESAVQLAARAHRLGIKTKNITVLEDTDVDEVIRYLGTLVVGNIAQLPSNPVTQQPSLIIVDSIQTLTTQDLTGTAGSIGQVKECAARITIFAKKNGIPTFIVGQVNKEGAIAGPRVLEHMVDTVLWFEGDRREFLRIVRAVKNRFGGTEEVAIFSMEEQGLKEITNPSKMFLGEIAAPGSVPTVLLEGSRPIIVEIQALVVPTKLPFPKRAAQGVDQRRLEIIVAVLTRRALLPLFDFDIFVNVAGGIKVQDPSCDLAIALSIASAFFDKPFLPKRTAIGEVGLLGEIRTVPQEERRIKEARRLGFTSSVTNKEIKTVKEAIKKYVSTN